MKRFIPILIAIAMFLPQTAMAVPVTWDFSSNVLKPLQSLWNKEVQVPWIQATSTTATSTLPIASSTTICLGSDCRTAWPATGGSPTWGSIGGTLSNQTDLQNALDAKIDTSSTSLGVVTSIPNLSITESQISDLTHTTDTNLTEEEVEDFVGGMLGGTETLITVTYVDGTNDIDFVVDSNLSNYNNDAGFLTGITGESLESLSDVASFAQSTNDVLYWNGSAWDVTSTSTWDTDTTIPALTEEEVEDFVGGMLGGTETGISVTYQDGTNDIDFVLDTTGDWTGTFDGQEGSYYLDFSNITVTADEVAESAINFSTTCNSSQKLYIDSGNLACGTDASGGGGGSGLWASTTNSGAIYPVDTTDVVLIGASATTSANTILEVNGGINISEGIARRGETDNEWVLAADQQYFSVGGIQYLWMDDSAKLFHINRNVVDFDTYISTDNDQYAFVVNGGTDNIGIGTSTPLSKLHVVGTTTIHSATDNVAMRLYENSGGQYSDIQVNTSGDLEFYSDSGTQAFQIGGVSDGLGGGAVGFGDELYVLGDTDTYISNPIDTWRFTAGNDNLLVLDGSNGQAYFQDATEIVMPGLMDIEGSIYASSSIHVQGSGSDLVTRFYEQTGGEYYDLTLDSNGDLAFVNDAGTEVMVLQDSSTNIQVWQLEAMGDSDTQLQFVTDTIRLYAGGTTLLDVSEGATDTGTAYGDLWDFTAVSTTTFAHASTTKFTFGGVTGTAWTDFCTTITGGSGLCDGTDADTAALTEEEVEDFVGGMLGGTETGISVTYQDGTNDIDFAVDDVTPTMLAAQDFGDWTCNGTTCSLDSGVVDSTAIANDTIQAIDLEATNTEVDDDIVTYDSGTGGFTFNSGPELCVAITGSADLCDGSDDGGGGSGGLGTSTPWTAGDIVEVVDNGTVKSTSTLSESKIDSAIARDSELHDAVTLAGQDYLTLSTQQITAGEIQPDDLANADFGEFTCNGTTCVLEHDALDDQYYDSEADLTALLDDDYEGELNNEAGLYAALSDVTQFWEAGDTINSGAVDGEIIQNDTIDDDSIDFADVTLLDFGLAVTHDTASELDALYEAELDNEAGLYAALSDVTQFWEAGDTINSGTLAFGSLTLTGEIDFGDNTNATAGRSLTLTGDDIAADAELYTDSFSMILYQATSTDDAILQWEAPVAITITEVTCSTDAGTVTVQLDERTATTPNSAGTDIMSSTLVCDTNEQATASFANAGIAAGALVSLDVDATAAGQDETMRLHVKYTKDD